MKKYEVCFAMCHCEYTTVELDEEDIEGKTEDEIKVLVRKQAWYQIRRECREVKTWRTSPDTLPLP